MRKIYIVLTHTGTILSRVIKLYTKNEFTHCSISLDEELTQMYSFGRLHPHNAFIGGFIHEYLDKGTFKVFARTMSKVYELEVTDEQYEEIKTIISTIEKNKKEYRFNVIGLFAVSLKVRFNREKTFYCAEFVKYVLEKSGVVTNLPILIKPEDFKYIENTKVVYAGLLRKYKPADQGNIYVKAG